MLQGLGEAVSQELGRLLVGQVTMGGTDALLEVPGIAPLEEQLWVMVELENGHGKRAELLSNQLRRTPQVGDHADPRLSHTNPPTHGLWRVVGHPKGIEDQMPQPDGLVRRDELNAIWGALRLQPPAGSAGHQEGNALPVLLAQGLGQDPRSSDVV